MLGFYIPLFYGDCTTQSLQSGFSQQIHISDLISSYFYLKLTQMFLSTINFWGMTKKIGDKELFLDSILCLQGMIS